MTGVSESDISITSITDNSTPNLNSNSVSRKLSLRSSIKLKSGESTSVEYKTTAVLQSFGGKYSSVDDMISDLNNQVSYY